MLTDKTFVKPVDFRVTVYRFVRQLVIIAGAGLLIKTFLLDTVLIKTDEMAPTLLPGDRVVMVRLPFAPLLSSVLGPGRRNIILFDLPRNQRSSGCLRVTALSGDSMSITDAALTIHSTPAAVNEPNVPQDLVLPADYSPRDQMAPLRIAGPGTRISFDKVSVRDLVFYASMAAQEHPERHYTVDAGLFLDGIPVPHFAITAFPLYKGDFDSIPDSLRYNWFFWDRLIQYLNITADGQRVDIQLRLTENGTPLETYTFSRRFVFLTADNWVKGYDSRYYGPVIAQAGRGMVIGVLWSRGTRDSGKKFLRWSRLMRIVT